VGHLQGAQCQCLAKVIDNYTGIAAPEDDPRGLKHVGAKNTRAKVQIVIFSAFNNKN
jgi:hypothetical protein